MATSIQDTGEAYLSAADKCFARIGAVGPSIHSTADPARSSAASPVLTIAVLILAVAAFAVAALVG